MVSKIKYPESRILQLLHKPVIFLALGVSAKGIIVDDSVVKVFFNKPPVLDFSYEKNWFIFS